MSAYYIVDVRREFSRNRYITLWRPNNAGYSYPLPWSGRFTLTEVEAHGSYYYSRRYGSKRVLDRYPVPCEIVDQLGASPRPGDIDDNCGPVVFNTKANRDVLRRNAYRPATCGAKVQA